MVKIVAALILGIGIGYIGTVQFYSYMEKKSNELSVLTQYKYSNSHLINNGTDEAIKSQLNTWLSFLETYKPNKYSPLPTKEAVNLEKTGAYYILANLEKNINSEKYQALYEQAIKSCKKTAKNAVCTEQMLKLISCVMNLFSNKSDCMPNNIINSDSPDARPISQAERRAAGY